MKKSKSRKVLIFIVLTVFTIWNVVRGTTGFVTALTALSAFVCGVILWADYRDQKKRWN